MIQRVVDVDLGAAADPEIFAYAVRRGYVLVTGNIKDFRPLAVQWAQAGNEFPGIIFIRAEHQKNAALIASSLIRYAYQDMKNREAYV